MSGDALRLDALAILYADADMHDAWSHELELRSRPYIERAVGASRTLEQDIADAAAMWIDRDRWRAAKEHGWDDDYWLLPMLARRQQAEDMRAAAYRAVIVPPLYGDPHAGTHGRASVAETAGFFLGGYEDWCREHEPDCAEVLLDAAYGDILAARAEPYLPALEDRVEQAVEDGEYEVEVDRAQPWTWSSDMILAMVSPWHSTLPGAVWAWESWMCLRDCWRAGGHDVT